MSVRSRQLILDALQAIAEATKAAALPDATRQLLSALGYASQKTLNLPSAPNEFAAELAGLLGEGRALNPERAGIADWRSAAFLFQLTDDELPALAAGQQSFFATGGMRAHQIESFVFIALDLNAGSWSRTRLALMTREINRIFPMPAILLFRHPDANDLPLLSIAVIHRRVNKRDALRDVIESKVSVIKDVNLQHPHAAHLRILESLCITAVDDKFVPSTFDALYIAWLKVLNVKALNDKFYGELAQWYYWAVLQETGVQFPPGQPVDDSNDPATNGRPTVAMIRLLTRVIFVWFLKEKGLVPAELFDLQALANILKHPPNEHAGESNFYKAILQNLFFATLNTETVDENGIAANLRTWREQTGPKRMDEYLIHTVYRYKSHFKDSDAAIALFRQVPFLNGGLFECLDKLVSPADLKRNPALTDRIVREGKQTVLRVDGFSERPENLLCVPNELFFSDGKEGVDLNTVFDTRNRKYKPRGLLKIFESYKFTIEENTPIEEEVALDPELLGKVFENLLASYNPDTKTTARKKSGSFYTPREVVDYMVDEALVAYFEQIFPTVVGKRWSDVSSPSRPGVNAVLELGAGEGDLDFGESVGAAALQSADGATATAALSTGDTALALRLRRALSYRHSGHDFSAAETQTIVAAIEKLRVLDPACGSGAFPMGMLQKLVHLLRTLDPDNELWKAQNRTPLTEQLTAAKKIKDPTLRDEQVTSAQSAIERFDADFADPDYADYARKLYLIEKCIYGVDIQPIAVQIAKLRFFVSLVVEQRLGTDQQRITPLPNLETKIVTANTLLQIPRSARQASLLDDPAVAEKEAELREANASHFAAKRFADKRRRKDRILRLRDELAALLKAEFAVAPVDADRMSAWDPFDQNRAADFFDPEWMFGFSGGFDVVIGNPPYVRQEAIKDQKPALKPLYDCYSGTADLYVYFYERSIQLLNPHGVLSFITSNKWFRAKYGEPLRAYMSQRTTLRQIIDFGDEDVFDALAYPTIVIAVKRERAVAASDERNDVLALNWDSKNENYKQEDFPEVFASSRFDVPQRALNVGGWQLEPPIQRRMLERLRKAGQPLGDYCKGRFYRGVLTGLNEAFVVSREQRDALVAQHAACAEIIKPFLRGKDVKRWNVEFAEQYLIKIESSENVRHPWSRLDAPAAEKKFAKTFPSIYVWFTQENRREQLIERTDQGHYFWELRSCAYWDQFLETKIIVPAIAASPIAALDQLLHFSNNKSTFFLPPSLELAAACINSPISAWMAVQTFATKQGGFYDFEPRYSGQLPIPSATAAQLAGMEPVVHAITHDISAPEFERLLNGLVYELFFPDDLHAKKIRLFEACADAGVKPGMDASVVAAKIFAANHPIYGMLFDLQSIDAVRTIENLD